MVSEVDPKAMGEMVAAARERRWPVLLAGPCGVGKSCLAALVASKIPGWRFIAVSELLAAVVSARTSDAKTVVMRTMAGQEVERSEFDIFRWVEDSPMLVLDDLGVRRLTEVQGDILLRVCDLRLSKPTIVTTNCDARQLREFIGDRATSRLLAGARIWMDGKDRRDWKRGDHR